MMSTTATTDATPGAAPLPTALFEGLLKKLAAVLELVQKAEELTSFTAKQALQNATNNFRDAVNQAKEVAVNLPGGEMLTEEQDEVIEMLIKLRDQKRERLFNFTNRPITSSGTGTETKMEIDSVASTPA